MKNIPFFNLTRQYNQIKTSVDAAVAEVLAGQQCIGGPHIQALEKALADRVGAKHAIGVSSGTDALLVSLMALDLGPGDEVITSPFTFFSPIGAILRRGATPVFVDIDDATFNLDPRGIEEAITENTRAILPVHLFGQTCDMTAISTIAEAHGLAVIEDMAQAIGSTHQGRPAGSFGTTACVSFFPTKNLGAAGDGGMVFCQDDDLADKIRRLCRHGAQPKYHHVDIGGNFRLDALQAAILRQKLPHLSDWTAARRRHAAFYDEAFADRDEIITPQISEENQSVYNQYVIRVPNRDELRSRLTEAGVGTNIYYPEPVHTQPALGVHRQEVGAFPKAEKVCEEVLALPIFGELREEERERVSEGVRRER